MRWQWCSSSSSMCSVIVIVLAGAPAGKMPSPHKLKIVDHPIRAKVILIADKTLVERQVGAHSILIIVLAVEIQFSAQKDREKKKKRRKKLQKLGRNGTSIVFGERRKNNNVQTPN